MLRHGSLRTIVLLVTSLGATWLGCAGKNTGATGGAGGTGGSGGSSTRATSSSSTSASSTGSSSSTTSSGMGGKGSSSGTGGKGSSSGMGGKMGTGGAGGATSSSGMGGKMGTGGAGGATSSGMGGKMGTGGAGGGTTSSGTGGAGGATSSGMGGAGGGCAHDVCTQGAALDPNCSTCAGLVCAQDPLCCDPMNGWDAICVSEVPKFCNGMMCGGGAGGGGAGGGGAGGGGAGGAGGAAPVALMINEIDYDNVGTDTAEYVEVYNGGASSVNLTGYKIVLVNGANNAVYQTIDLGPAGTIKAGQYLVAGATSVVSGLGANVLKIDLGAVTNYIQNGSPDGVALIDSNKGVLVDALSYEGAITMAVIPGVGTVSLVEGTVLPSNVADSNTVQGTLCRLPNGTDTNNAATDWKFCGTVTPGAANMP